MRLRDIFWIIDTKNSRALITKWAEKAGKDAEKVISYVEETYKETNDQLAAGKWICEGYEPKQFPQALYICKQKKLDPLKQNPDELVEKNPEVKPKDKPINPNAVLTDRKEDGEGNVTYAARDEDREVLRQLINTHYGIDANPWCLLQAENGKLTNGSMEMWDHYNAYPKRIAFRDGKLLAFSAGTDKDMREWWDRFDRSFPFIPYDGKSWIGREGGSFEIRKGNVFETRGNSTSRLNTEYSTDIEESTTDITIDTKRHIITDRWGTYPYEEKDGKYVVTNGRHDYDHRAVTFTLTKYLELDGEYIERNMDNGKILKKTTYTNGKREGPYEEYYTNGQLYIKCTYKNDKVEGPFEQYYENGQLESKQVYKNGKQNGPLESYYENGQLNTKCIVKNGRLEGPLEEYFDDGQLRRRCTYKNGEVEGFCEQYYANGQLKSKGTYKDGYKEDLFVFYYKNGFISDKTTYKNGMQNGLEEKYYPDGQLKIKSIYKNDRRDGPFEYYNENGQLEIRCVYKDGHKDGPYEEYRENGQLWIKATYKDDKYDGLYEEYHYNGQLWERSTYKDGKLDGLCEGYDKDGQLDYRYTYKDGKKVG